MRKPYKLCLENECSDGVLPHEAVTVVISEKTDSRGVHFSSLLPYTLHYTQVIRAAVTA